MILCEISTTRYGLPTDKNPSEIIPTEDCTTLQSSDTANKNKLYHIAAAGVASVSKLFSWTIFLAASKIILAT
jgi:hypothetical protein